MRYSAKDLSIIPLSNDTVKRQIDGLSANIKEQLLERIRLSPYFALQLDESMDITNKATLLCYVRYQPERNVFEDILFISSLVHTTSEEIFNNLNEFITSHDMDWLKCIEISTDGARAMSGKLTGLVAWIKEIVLSVTWYHCCIHREALVAKKIPEKLKQALNESVEIVNFIRSRSLNSRLFEQLCEDMNSEHQQLLLHCDVHLLSRGKVLSHFWELRDEIRLFLMGKQFHLSDHLTYFSWLVKLAYLSDIFIHLNMLNLSLQGEKITVFEVEDKIEAMIKKLKLWHHCLLNQDYGTFPNLRSFLGSIDEEMSKEDHSFCEYFPVPDVINVYELEGLTAAEEDKLIEISTDGAPKLQFKEQSLPNFWAHLQADFPELSKRAMKVLMPFVTMYLCKKSFSALVYLKNKHRNYLKNGVRTQNTSFTY
uniref:HAT C-terminal dimerisation domain-containing protein n=1 Tax=Strix occidentalis caurina TaxID=311401 RepID=A0A8D0KS80_STROC